LELIGAGGSVSSPAYELEPLAVGVADHCTVLDSVLLLVEKSGSPDEFYGNLGQSFLSRFASYTFDFQHMHFTVSGGAVAGCPNAAVPQN
jgi:hypothetical protein